MKASQGPYINQSKRHRLIDAANDLSATIAAGAEKAELAQRVPDEIIAQFEDAGFFKIATPREYGGDEVDLLTASEAFEILSVADASTTWVVMIVSANPYFMGNAVSDQVWQATYGQNPNLRSAGQIGPLGKAVKVDGGYRVSGRWNYGSGAEHCEYLTTGCLVYDGDKPVLDQQGQPEWRLVIHKLTDCTLLKDSWDTSGLRASGSYDYVIDDLFVPAEWTYVFGEVVNKLENPVYTYTYAPLIQLAAMMLGMAGWAIEFVTEVAKTKRRGPLAMRDDPAVLMRLAEAEVLHAGARAYLFDAGAKMLNALSHDRSSSTLERARYRLATTNAMDSAVKVIDMMYKAAGGSAIHCGTRLERMFRDVHTAHTHVQFSDAIYAKSARVMLGVDPQDRMF